MLLVLVDAGIGHPENSHCVSMGSAVELLHREIQRDQNKCMLSCSVLRSKEKTARNIHIKTWFEPVN